MEGEEFAGICELCGGGRFVDGQEGYYYCTDCNRQSQDVMETGVADEDFVAAGGEQSTGFYLARHRRRQPAGVPGFRAGGTVIKAEPISQLRMDGYVTEMMEQNGVKTEEAGGEEFIGPLDFGLPLGCEADDQARYKCTYDAVRIKYLMGVQLMLEMQCKALVETFEVNPLICGLASSIWLRFVAASEIFDEGWADLAISESEARQPDMPEEIEHPPRYFREFRNSYGELAIMIWYKSLRKMIPLSSSLAVAFLACHVARESVLPTDILKWTLEGKLPYLAAFTEIENFFARHSSLCPLTASFMFRPSEVVPMQKLEAMAAQVADCVGLHLPPVNFHAIASRYLKQLSLPVEKILQHANRIVDWSMPPELWLSVNESRLPTRVYVMAVIIVSIRILYNIHGFGVWEKSLCSHERKPDSNMSSQPRPRSQNSNKSPSCGMDGPPSESIKGSTLDRDSSLDAGELLFNLEATYKNLHNDYEYFKDLPAYLNYCKDVVFAGTELSNNEEKTIAEDFWNMYQNELEQNEEFKTPYDSMPKAKRSRYFETSQSHDGYSSDSKRTSGDRPTLSGFGKSSHLDDLSEQGHDDHASPHTPKRPSYPANDHHTEKEEVIDRLKADMEENRFFYIPPRVNGNRHDYLHYVRKKDEGAYAYLAHADYYILLRACARVAQVDIRIMHVAVMNFERRLAWMEKRIDHCLKLNSTPPVVEIDDCDESDQECFEEICTGVTGGTG